MSLPPSPQPCDDLLIRAASGLVWRDTPQGPQVLVVHRPHYDDWVIPKGKLKPNEAWDEAALREVREETGYAVRLERFAGVLFYPVGGRPKVVLFWNMRLDGDEPVAPPSADNPGETDAAVWLSPAEALLRLTHASEWALVEEEEKKRLNRKDRTPSLAGGAREAAKTQRKKLRGFVTL